MRIAIRKEENDLVYIDKHLRNDIPYTEAPYNFTIIEIDDKYSDCISEDFEGLTFSIEKYNKRKHDIECAFRIAELKQLLASSDYKAIKYGEGRLTDEEYAPISEQREAWREEIRELEKGVNNNGN